MTLKYNKFKCYWAVVTEKKHQIVSIERDRPFPLKFWTKNRVFLRPQLSLKSKNITNQERIGCLVYPEITQNKWTVPLSVTFFVATTRVAMCNKQAKLDLSFSCKEKIGAPQQLQSICTLQCVHKQL